jgi:aminocarboxymuconate-semialdehyde decarboxylase
LRDRRTFLALGACAAAGWLMPTPARAQARKQVTIAGRRVKTVDIHAHAAVKDVENVVRGTKFQRTIGGARLLGPAWIPMMDQWGIDVSVLSVNQYWWYAVPDRDLARRIIQVQDEGLAAWCTQHPTRFVALTSVALQHPDLAAEQLEYAVTKLGFRGASVGGHVEGEIPVSEKYDPFWAKAQELDVPVFMHPAGAPNVVRDGGLKFRGDLGNIVGNPLETTVFLSRMIFDGFFDRFPRLKVCGAHGGGFLPSYFGRTAVACNGGGATDCANRKPPREYLRTQIFADTMVFSDEGLRHLVAEMGASQVVYGTDMPLEWPDTMDLIINATFMNNAEKEAILGGNLIRMLRLDRTI